MKQILFISLCFLVFQAIGQEADPILFTVQDQDVKISEFDYIYNKNNRDGADYSKASLKEYLDLYVKFKLKVQRARDMKLDTITQLQKELAGYRKQLANSYLNDREVKDRLVREAFDRMQKDVRIAHILVELKARATPADTAKAYETISKALQRIKNGESFESVAAQVSQDGNSKLNGGDIGYLTAIMPSGFYAVESAAYEVPVGEVSGIVKSTLGYHLIKVLDRRPARGTMDGSHILVRINKQKSNESTAKSKIEQLYQQIQDGKSFEQIARQYSEDETTSKRGGFIGTFGINTYDAEFEDAAFALEKDGDISKPVKTRLGYHIIKRMRKKKADSFETAKRKIESQISKNERIDFAKASLIQRIKEEGDFSIDEKVYRSFTDQVDGDLFNYRWTPPKIQENTLFSFGDEMSVSNTEFAKFIRSSARLRMRLPKTTSKEGIIQKMMDEFVKEKALAYEERKLVDKYPDFKALMREYEEGILLFEATKINVWDKASEDTVGLQKFYEQNQNNFMWKERASLVRYTLPAGNEKLLTKLKKFANKFPAEKVVTKLNKKESLVSFSRKKFEKGDDAFGTLEWKKGAAGPVETDDTTQKASFEMIESLLPPTPKSLSEARGYIVADYQDQLEKEWVTTLRNLYTVQINEQVFESLIKK